MKQPVTQSMQYPKMLYSEEYRGFKFYKTSTGLWYFENHDLDRNWFTLVPTSETQPLLECAFYNDVSVPDSEHEHVKTMRKVIDQHIEYETEVWTNNRGWVKKIDLTEEDDVLEIELSLSDSGWELN